MWWGYGVIRRRKKNYSNKLQWNEKQPVKMQNFYILLAYLLTAIALLTAVSIYCYLIKYQAKQKHLLSFHYTKLKQVYNNNINWKWVQKSKI